MNKKVFFYPGILIIMVLFFNCPFLTKIYLKDMDDDNGMVQNEGPRPLLMNILAYWSLDGHLNDAVSTQNNGTLNINYQSYFIDSTGDEDSAINFYNNYLEIPDHSALDFDDGSFSISFWLKASSNAYDSTILDKRLITGSKYIGFQVRLLAGRMCVQIGDGVSYGLNNLGVMNFWDDQYKHPVLTDNEWHFIEINVERTVGFNTVTVYGDGELRYSKGDTSITGGISNASDLYVGRTFVNNLTGQMYGALDDLKFYSGVGEGKTLVSHYPFNGSTEDSVSHNDADNQILNPSQLPVAVGKVFNCLNFSGHFVTIEDSSQLNSSQNPFAFRFWLKTGAAGTQPVLDKMEAPGMGYSVLLDEGRVVLKLGDGDNILTFTDSSGLLVNDNQWNLVDIIINETEVQFFINNDYQSSIKNTILLSDIDNSAPLIIGKLAAQDNSFEGYLDEVQIFIDNL